MEDLILKIKRIAKENPEGFTISIKDLSHIKKGWIVALKETQNSFGDKGLRKVIETSLKTTYMVGGWKEEKLFYFDTVQIFNTEAEAIQAGIENDQISIYNLESGKLIYL
ncbi:hypothetical protein [Rhodonellum sp.]|uniref:hypothetical protein n=1 Tax=Rhodonellum sp. TaxID=2231180 RepID=UPI002719BB7C|nr:hypothetical protein [Rhodonellum sp.]MDO9554519.1 hypothetical protein [Rhodonellum sp.]